MEPRYYTGDTLFVDPKLDVQSKDDVVVMFQLPDRMAGIFREFVGETDDQIVVKAVAGNKPVTLNKAEHMRYTSSSVAKEIGLGVKPPTSIT